MQTIEGCLHLGRVVFGLSGDVLMFLGTALLSRPALAAETLAPRKRLAERRGCRGRAVPAP
jgi:hypothetical protein